MALDQDIQYLSRVQLFQGFQEEQLRLLAFGARHRTYRAGETVFIQNEISKGGYIIMHGQIDLVAYKGELEVPVGSFIENSIVGELSLISQNRCVATAVSRTESELLFISRDLFLRMLEEYPELAIMLHERISKNVKVLVDQLESVERKLINISDLS